MKKLMFLFFGLFVLALSVHADNDKPVQVSEMPKAAQQFIRRHFSAQSVAVAKMETDFMARSYDVIFTNGDKVEFDRKGKWTSVDCEHSRVPQEIIPLAIQKYVSEQYPATKVVKIELTDRKGYEVELDNGIEVEFDKRMNVKEIDR